LAAIDRTFWLFGYFEFASLVSPGGQSWYRVPFWQFNALSYLEHKLQADLVESFFFVHRNNEGGNPFIVCVHNDFTYGIR